MLTKLSFIVAACGVVLTMLAFSLGQASAMPPIAPSSEAVSPTTLSNEELKDVYRDVANDLDKALVDLESAESRADESAKSSAAVPSSSDTPTSVAMSSAPAESSALSSGVPPSSAVETSAAPGDTSEVAPFFPSMLPKDICAGKGVQAYLVDEPREKTKHARVSIGVSGCERKKDTSFLITLPNTKVLSFENANYPLYAPGSKEEIGTVKANGTLITVRFSANVPNWQLLVHATVEQAKDGPVSEKILVDGKRFEFFFGQKVSHCGSECQAPHPRGYAVKWSHFSTETVELFSTLQGVPSKDGSFTITDTVPGGSAKFVCSALLYKAHENTGRNEDGTERGKWLERDAKVSCDDNKVSVEWPQAKAGERYALYVKSNPVTKADGLDVHNRACYLDQATFTGVAAPVQAEACMPQYWSNPAYGSLPAAAATTTLTSIPSSSKPSSSQASSTSAATSSSVTSQDSSISPLVSSTSASTPAEPSSEPTDGADATTSVTAVTTETASTANTSPETAVSVGESSSSISVATSTRSATTSVSHKAASTHNPTTTRAAKPSGDRGRLASTGANVLWIGLGAVVVIGVGAAIVLWSNRRCK